MWVSFAFGLISLSLTTRSGRKRFSFNFKYFWMTSEGIKAWSENSTEHFGANRIIGFISTWFYRLGSLGQFLLHFSKLRIKTDVSFSTTLSKYLIRFKLTFKKIKSEPSYRLLKKPGRPSQFIKHRFFSCSKFFGPPNGLEGSIYNVVSTF